MKLIIAILISFFSLGLFAQSEHPIDEIRVYKSKRKMDMLFQGKVIKSYKVMLGRGGLAPKKKAGDKLVPEGQYFLDYKNSESLFHKSIHISYPNAEDSRRASEEGIDPGGDIMIHGYPNKPKPLFKFLEKIGLIKLVNWTAGCIAVDDVEIDEIYDNVDEHTPITIYQ